LRRQAKRIVFESTSVEINSDRASMLTANMIRTGHVALAIIIIKLIHVTIRITGCMAVSRNRTRAIRPVLI
jgi:hypothetical protein